MVTLAGPKDYISRPGHLVIRFVFFISSGSDVDRQRDLFEGMVREASTQFRLREDADRPFVLEVDRWEQDAARRTTEMNEEFVRRAKAAHATVVLLATEVRAGTREEIEAVLDEDDVQLSVIWMESPSSARKSRTLKKFLREHSNKIAYQRTCAPDSDEAVLAMIRVVAAASPTSRAASGVRSCSVSTAKRGEDDLYRACITWDVPAIRRDGSDEAMAFLRTMQLLPSAFAEQDVDPRTERMSPLRRATFGLRAELSGDSVLAKELYSAVARQSGLRGLLGQLLLAWTSDAKERDFARVETRLGNLSGPGSRDVAARCHCKLATWAGDHGWRDRAAHHFERARTAAGADLRAQLDEIGHWFGADQVLHFGRPRGDMVLFPWIDAWADAAARKSVEEEFKRSFRSPWTRYWTFGSSSGEGMDIQSAELQASWTGALWLLPAIQREHAALLLTQPRATKDVARGIALWVRGGGATPGRLIDFLEGHLTQNSIEELLVTQLHQGLSVARTELWWESCLALWSELPAQVVDSLIERFVAPLDDLDPNDEAVTGLTLFGYLLPQSERAAIRAQQLSDEQLAVLLRVLAPGVVDRLPPSIVERGLLAALADEDGRWRGVGWPALARAWWRLPAEAGARLRPRVAERLPRQDVPEAATIAPGLLRSDVLNRALDEAVTQVAQDVKDASRGRFSGRLREPATNVQRLVSALDVPRPYATAVLVRQAGSPVAAPVQRQAALAALISLARDSLLAYEDVEPALAGVDGPVLTLMADDEADRRYEDVQRAALHVALRYDERFDGVLLAASRDPSTRVRVLAVSTVTWLTAEIASSGALDATLLGALYDPHPRVQSFAVPALWRGRFASEVVRRTAQDRVVEVWPTAHLDFRAAVAQEMSSAVKADDRSRMLAAWSREDRSVLVRWAAEFTDT